MLRLPTHFPSLLFLFSLLLLTACGDDGGDVTTPPPPAPEPVVNPINGLTAGGLELADDVYLPPATEAWTPLADLTNEFNAASKDDPSFRDHFSDDYHNGWNGPGQTFWNTENSTLEDGMLVLSATRRSPTKVNCGVMTSKETVQYPLYTEVRARVADQVLSSNFWFLSPDDKREIDVLEVYGSSRSDHSWFAANASTNYHVFIRDDQTNAILQDLNEQQHHHLPGNEPWRNEFHRYGMYWKDAWTIDFYYDGELVHELRRAGINDPEGLGLDRPMHLIIDLESHQWREDRGFFASDAELSDADPRRDYRIDYLRSFRPAEAFDGGLIANGSFDDYTLANWYLDGNVGISTDLASNAEGELVALKLAPGARVIQPVTVSAGTGYDLSFTAQATAGGATVGIFDGASTDIGSSSDWTDGSLSFTTAADQTTVYVVIENGGSGTVRVDRVGLR